MIEQHTASIYSNLAASSERGTLRESPKFQRISRSIGCLEPAAILVTIIEIRFKLSVVKSFVVLDSIVEDRLPAEASKGTEDQKLVEQLNLDKRQLGQLLLQPAQNLSAETNQRIETLEVEVEKTESQLAQHVAGLGKVWHALSLSLEQVQSAIPNDGALVEYLRYGHYLGKGEWEQRYGAIVLFSKGTPLWIPLGKAKEIEHLVRRYGAVVRGSPQEDELSANLQALYEALSAPIGQALPSQIKRIIISPDGQLNFISFATLLTKDKQFLAERYNIQYVASGRDLLRELKPSRLKNRQRS